MSSAKASVLNRPVRAYQSAPELDRSNLSRDFTPKQLIEREESRLRAIAAKAISDQVYA